MPAKIDIAALTAPNHTFYVREIAGIFEAIGALLLVLALASHLIGEQWVGLIGDKAAWSLVFLLGRYTHQLRNVSDGPAGF